MYLPWAGHSKTAAIMCKKKSLHPELHPNQPIRKPARFAQQRGIKTLFRALYYFYSKDSSWKNSSYTLA
jgi:hypothetical protein